MADDGRSRCMTDYAMQTFNNLNIGIARSTIEANNFELQQVMFKILQTMRQSRGCLAESPHFHLKPYIEVCYSFKIH